MDMSDFFEEKKQQLAALDYSEYRWMSCSKDADWATSQYRHLIIPGRLTTVCGCTASHADVWRTSTTKMNCLECSKSEKGKAIIKWQTEAVFGKLEPPVQEKPLPRKVVFSVNVSVQLVEEKPTEVSVIPVGQMSRSTTRELAVAALEEAGFPGVPLDSGGFSEHGAFFSVRLREPEPEPKPVKRTDCICSYNTHRPFLGQTRTDITRNPKCPVDHSS